MTGPSGPGPDASRGDTVLVTGASGFVGRELMSSLRAGSYRVVGASRSPSAQALQGGLAVLLPPPTEIGDAAFEALMTGVTHVVHLAGIAHTRLPVSESAGAYRAANFLLTERLVRAAAKTIPGKFVFLSSIRAQCGAVLDGVARETDTPLPTDDYGRSKLEAERAVAAVLTHGRYTILRPVLVYGPGVRGNMGSLASLARLPVPLPFAGLSARRSLVSRTSLCEAVLHCLRQASTDRGTYVVADRQPVTPPQIVAALRAGLGRSPGLFALPPALLRIAAAAAGQKSRFETLEQDLVASSASLEATGWNAVPDTVASLADTMRRTG